MGIKTFKPKTHSLRFKTVIDYKAEVTTDEPFKPLLDRKNRINGRNNYGQLTVRHRGGGNKKHYRVIDFRRDKAGIPARVETIEYDPNRSAFVAQESDERRPIRIVFDGFHPCRNTSLVAAEIDHAIVLLVPAAAMANGKLAVIVAAVDSILAVQKRLERLVGCDFRLVVDDRLKTKRVGLRLESFDSHYMFSPYSIIFSPSRSVTYAFFQSGR